MVCFHKNLILVEKNGTNVIFYGKAKNFSPKEIRALQIEHPNYSVKKVPCRKCIGCRIEQSRQWAMRILHESKVSDCSSFITLTYAPDEDNLTYNFFRKNRKHWTGKKCRKQSLKRIWTLCPEDYQLFMKRLRKAVKKWYEEKGLEPKKVRFFHCGEYGEAKGRPHHHAIIFNFAFPDRKVYKVVKKKGRTYVLYTSELLNKCWPHGYAICTDVTYDSAAYVSRYCTKKINGQFSDTYYNGRKQEYITMSNRRGIGYEWYKKYAKTDAYIEDNVICNGKKLRVPAYYDKLFDIDNAEAFAKIKANREKIATEILMKAENIVDNTKERLEIREKLLLTKLKRLVRSVEQQKPDESKYIEYINKCKYLGMSQDEISKYINMSVYYIQKAGIDTIGDVVKVMNDLIDTRFGYIDWRTENV